jgi:hypothetical protein
MRRSGLLILDAQEELTTSAHGALKHLKHDTSKPELLGGGPFGGLAVVSQESRSTTWSLTRRLKHSVAVWASTWNVRQKTSSKRLELFLPTYALDVVWLHECVVS